MNKIEYRYRIEEDREFINDHGYDYMAKIEAREICGHCGCGKWRVIQRLNAGSDYDWAVEQAKNQIEWLRGQQLLVA